MTPIDLDALLEFIDCGHLRNPGEKCFSEQDLVEILKSRPTLTFVEIMSECSLDEIYSPATNPAIEDLRTKALSLQASRGKILPMKFKKDLSDVLEFAANALENQDNLLQFQDTTMRFMRATQQNLRIRIRNLAEQIDWYRNRNDSLQEEKKDLTRLLNKRLAEGGDY